MAIVQSGGIGAAEANVSTFQSIPETDVRNVRLRGLPVVWAFPVACVLLAVYCLIHFPKENVEIWLTGCLLAVVCLIPGYLWCTGKVCGLPIFPPITALYLVYYALPLIRGKQTKLHRNFQTTSWEMVQVGLTIAGLLLIAICIWAMLTRRPPAHRPHRTRVLDSKGGEIAFLIFLLIGAVWTIAVRAGWIDLPIAVFMLINSMTMALCGLGVVCLAYLMGAGKLSPTRTCCFVILLVALMIAQLASLYIHKPVALTMMGSIAYVAASRRLPLLWLIPVFAIAIFLQNGKSKMRAQTWKTQVEITPLEYPDFFRRWAEFSVVARESDDTKMKPESMVDRASLVQMVLLVQHFSPDPQPFLYGKTYAVIPELLIPRFLHPGKPRALAGQYILCTYYGLQTEKQTLTTGISFGLPAEAYANFGYPGIAGLGLLLGLATGLVTRMSYRMPILSLRSCFALAFLGIGMNLEASAAVVATTLAQGSFTLIVASWLLMKSEPLGPSTPH
jgi:hypothetical protein